MKTKITIPITLEIEVEVNCDYTPGHEGTFYRSNGDPGDPPEPPEFFIESVIWDGLDITKNLDKIDFDWEYLTQQCEENFDNFNK